LFFKASNYLSTLIINRKIFTEKMVLKELRFAAATSITTTGFLGQLVNSVKKHFNELINKITKHKIVNLYPVCSIKTAENTVRKIAIFS